MRNEIFSRISQNKIHYYAELKNGHSKLTIDKNTGPDISRNETAINSKKDNVTFLITSLFIKRKLLICLTYIAFHTRNIKKYLSVKANIQSSRLTESLSRMSSQLFEDQYEYEEQDEMDQGTNYQPLSIMHTSVANLSIPYEVYNYNLVGRFRVWIQKVYRNIILFLDSDNWFEKIDQSLRSTKLPLEKHLDHVIVKKIERVKIFFKKTPSIGKANNPVRPINKKKWNNCNSAFYSKIMKKLRTSSTTLFPAINRFI